MHQVLICGAGKIGTSIACMLAESGDYDIHISDLHFEGDDIKRMLEVYPHIATVQLDVQDKEAVKNFLQANKKVAVISCLPYHLNKAVAEHAKTFGLHYFDLTEDVSVTKHVKELSQGASNAFVPQCGLAPGYIGLAANHLMQHFDEIDVVKLRVGALPQQNSNALHYALTWSTEGVINEYGNPCEAIVNYEDVMVQPLEGLEILTIEGAEFEAFNTSGGLGSLTTIYDKKVRILNYKTMRYPGHCHKMRLLMNDLKLNQDRDTLKRILENAIPKTYQDMVVTYVSVTGKRDGVLHEESIVRKIYPQQVGELHWSAIQVSTTAGVCAIVDLLLSNPERFKGLIFQEHFAYDDFIQNRFGRYYA